MKLYRTSQGALVEHAGAWQRVAAGWDELLCRDDLALWLASQLAAGDPGTFEIDADGVPFDVLPPIEHQEVWACGVTYYRSRDARMAESKQAGGDTFYDRVYDAPRAEIFFKATPHRTVGDRQKVRIRRDSTWNVPELELTLVITPAGRIIGYTIVNDMSSRDIEGENPLYLPQAKIYNGCCALGPGIVVQCEPPPRTAQIHLKIDGHGRKEHDSFEGRCELSQLKRDPQSLVDYLLRDNTLPHGGFVLTGTGIVPPDTFSLQSGDRIAISIDGIGTLVNDVA